MSHQGYYTNPSNLENINDALLEVNADADRAEAAANNAEESETASAAIAVTVANTANQALGYATAAQASAVASNNSALASGTYASTSATNASNATASAVAANNSAIAAAGSATAANNSAIAAANSAASVVPSNFLLKANNLSDVTSPSAARANLGVVPQASNTDATTGRLVTVGGFGRNGGNAINPLGGNANAFTSPGTYLLNPSVFPLSNVPDTSAIWVLDVIGFYNQALGATELLQTLTRRSSVEIYTRAFVNGAWTSWILRPISETEFKAVDLNTVKISGTYGLLPTSTNSPTGNYGYLTVQSIDVFTTKQEFTAIGISGGIYSWERYLTSGVWGAWFEKFGDSGYLNPTLVNGFVDADTLRYRKKNGIVYIGGQIKIAGSVPNITTMFTLPVGFRPANRVSVATLWSTGGITSQHSITQIDPNTGVVQTGLVYNALGVTPAGPESTLTFGISFPTA